MLEENSFRGHTADFVVMFLFGSCSMVVFALFVNLLFLGKFISISSDILIQKLKDRRENEILILKISGQAFTIMLVYVWARRNPMVRMNFFGLLTFQAPYLPWVLLGFSLLLGNSVSVDLLGMAVGHIYYFLEDVFPNQPGGKRLLQTPLILRVISIA